MDIFSIFTLCGGLAFFLYGMQVMSSGLEKVSGGKLESMLRQLTSNPMKSLALGAGITIAIQSSSALTVMLVGLVNSRIMDFGQTIGVIMGSNIGTTLTAWILSLAGIDESANILLRLLKPESFSPIIALIGILMYMTSKNDRNKSIGGIMLGFAILMFGMELMKNSMSALPDMPEFTSILTAFKNPILGVIVGAVVTGVIQSSAASVGILQALSLTGSISFGMAIPIIMGQNIGTCMTALLSSIGVNTSAKRVTAVHVFFNVIGTTVCLIIFYGGNIFFHFKFMNDVINPVGIALVHTLFNIATTIMLLPFAKGLEKLAILVVKEKQQTFDKVIIDERLLYTPAFAIEECYNVTVKMAKKVRKNLVDSVRMLKEYNPEVVEKLKIREEKIDYYEDKLGSFLLRLSKTPLIEEQNNCISQLLLSIGDFERIGDHATRILQVATKMNEKNLRFSDDAVEELKVTVNAVKEIYDMTLDVFIANDVNKAHDVEPLEQVVDKLSAIAKQRHIKRLTEERCSAELGFMFSDVFNDLQRISDHCSSIATCVIQTKDASINKHELKQSLKDVTNQDFMKKYDMYSEKFKMPEAV